MFKQTLETIGRANLLPRWIRRKTPQAFSRRHVRHSCCLRGAMHLVEVGADLAGEILEISGGGCSFRPASMYMLDRNGETIMIATEYFSAHGKIRATRPDAYGIQFINEIDDATVAVIATKHPNPLTHSAQTDQM